MRNRLIGLGVLLAIVAAALTWQFAFRHKPVVTLKGYVGGEKLGFLDDSKVKGELKGRFGIVLDTSKVGSIEMVEGPVEGLDFLWPSSQVALELFKISKGGNAKSAVIFNSPIVIYSWDIVVDALIQQGIVTLDGGVYYVKDLPRLIQYVVEGKKWSDIGVPSLYGKVTVLTTDPTKSNSGNMWAGLLGNVLLGDVVDESTLPTVLPKIKDYFARLGFMESSSADLFEQYLKTGVGAKPMIVGYESQVIEFSLQNPDIWPSVKDRVRILYPIPTVWSAHPLIALDKKAEALIPALLDTGIQDLAWQKHGFRSGVSGAQNDPAGLQVAGIPKQILQVVSMPSAQVMNEIVQSLQTQ